MKTIYTVVEASEICYEIDGFVFFKSSEELIAGDFYNIKITSAGDYDLIGERVE